MDIQVMIEIPALDRLCEWLERRGRADVAEELKDEIIHQLEKAHADGTLEKAAKAPAEETSPETSPETRKAPQEPPKQEPTNAPATAPAAPATLDAVQRAAAQMRDEGRLKAVTDMFPEFGIKKLSDLKGDALQGFASRLRDMGAKL